VRINNAHVTIVTRVFAWIKVYFVFRYTYPTSRIPTFVNIRAAESAAPAESTKRSFEGSTRLLRSRGYRETRWDNNEAGSLAAGLQWRRISSILDNIVARCYSWWAMGVRNIALVWVTERIFHHCVVKWLPRYNSRNCSVLVTAVSATCTPCCRCIVIITFFWNKRNDWNVFTQKKK